MGLRTAFLSLIFSLAISSCAHDPVTRTPSSAPELIDPRIIDAHPVLLSTHSERLSDDPAMLALSKTLGGPLSDFYDYRNLFPRRFRLITGAEIQPLLDTLLEKIFSTTLGKKSFCFLAADDEKYIRFFLGASPTTGHKLKQACAAFPLSAQQMRAFRSMIFNPTGPLPPPPRQSKKFLLLVSEDPSPPAIEGFSTASDTTLFVFTRSDLTELNLLRTLAHELSMTFDQLSHLANSSVSQTWETGLPLVFDQPPWAPTGGYSTIYETPANQNALRCALRDPALRYAAATERSFRFEDALIAELGLSAQSPPLATGKDCRDSLPRWIPVFPLIFDVVRHQVMNETSFFERTCGETEPEVPATGNSLKDAEARVEALIDRFGNLKDPVRRRFLDARLADLESTTLRFKSNGKNQALCDLILNPKVGPIFPDAENDGGPRPRAGGF
ncbi:MAG: hypothetical protein ACXVCK_18115 [Bdellovibrionota bacterium]